MTKRRRVVLLGSILALATAALLSDKIPGPPVFAGPARAETYAPRTTSGRIAAANLNAKIAALGGARDASSVRPLVDALLARTQFFGSYSDFDRVATLVANGDADARATFASAVHDFGGALLLLDRAEHEDGRRRDAERTTIHLALGKDLKEVLASRSRTARAHPTFETLSALAAAEAAVGRFDEADATYARALGGYRDVSPFPVAWTLFQRGMLWAEMAGVPERAVPFYREAIARLPGYVVATVHLAELEADAGDRDAATARLRPLLETTEDPEPRALLATLSKAPDESARLREEARAGYEKLLAAHRNAFLDHAAEFFAGVGRDPARGLALAEENLALRPTDRAFAVAIRAARAAGNETRAKELAEQAGSERPSVPLQRLREDVLGPGRLLLARFGR